MGRKPDLTRPEKRMLVARLAWEMAPARLVEIADEAGVCDDTVRSTVDLMAAGGWPIHVVGGWVRRREE